MKLLFNKKNQGASELRAVTAQYYKNNDFGRIQMNIVLATEEIADLVGVPVYELAVHDYENGIHNDLIQYLQLPIAMKATMQYYTENMVSHEDTGRKVKIDNENEKMAWEWMINADDQAQQRKFNQSIERLIRYLDNANLDEWKNSERKSKTKELFLPNTITFNKYFNIDASARFYYIIVPLIYEVQTLVIAPAIGENFDRYLSEFRENLLDLPVQMHIQRALALQTMALVARRLGVSIMPDGVVQNFNSERSTLKSSSVVSADLWVKFYTRMQKDADEVLDILKRFLRKDIQGSTEYPLLPNQAATPKVFRT